MDSKKKIKEEGEERENTMGPKILLYIFMCGARYTLYKRYIIA